jgi:hypothetical protein
LTILESSFLKIIFDLIIQIFYQLLKKGTQLLFEKH